VVQVAQAAVQQVQPAVKLVQELKVVLNQALNLAEHKQVLKSVFNPEFNLGFNPGFKRVHKSAYNRAYNNPAYKVTCGTISAEFASHPGSIR